MKKVFKIALGCICSASMMVGVACGGDGNGYTTQETLNGKTTKEKYTEIMATIDAQSENFTSLIQYDIHCDISLEGQTVGMDMDMMTTIKMDGDNFIETDIIDGGELMGQDIGTLNMNVWYVDGVAYVDGSATGQYASAKPVVEKTKYTATIEQICEIAGLDQDTLWNPIYDFSDTAFDEVKFNVGANDSYFEIVMKGDDAAEYAEKSAALQGINGDMEIPQVNYKFMMDKDGNFDYVKIDYVMTMEMTIMGTVATYKYNYDGKIVFSDVGTTVVTAPTDGETWTDVTTNLPL